MDGDGGEYIPDLSSDATIRSALQSQWESAAAHTTEFALIRDDHRSYQAIAQATLFTFNQLGSLFVALCIGFLTLSSLRERGAPASA